MPAAVVVKLTFPPGQTAELTGCVPIPVWGLTVRAAMFDVVERHALLTITV